MSFRCLKCGCCCRDLIVKFGPCHIGLFLLPEETKLFPIDRVSPMWAVGMRGRSRPRPNVQVYQLNGKDCPYITSKNLCGIYNIRPSVCRAHPLSIHVNPLTGPISASVDRKCQGCKDIKSGEKQNLRKIFDREILWYNAILHSRLAKIFSVQGQPVFIYDVLIRRWKQMTAEMAPTSLDHQ